jgi:hypothetical protein
MLMLAQVKRGYGSNQFQPVDDAADSNKLTMTWSMSLLKRRRNKIQSLYRWLVSGK